MVSPREIPRSEDATAKKLVISTRSAALRAGSSRRNPDGLADPSGCLERHRHDKRRLSFCRFEQRSLAVGYSE